MLDRLGWKLLYARRQQIKAVMMYRVINKLVDINATAWSVLKPAGYTPEATLIDTSYHLQLSTPTAFPSFHPECASGTVTVSQKKWSPPRPSSCTSS